MEISNVNVIHLLDLNRNGSEKCNYTGPYFMSAYHFALTRNFGWITGRLI
jgi:hypothetical protein